MKSFKQYLVEKTISIYDTLENGLEDISEDEVLYNFVDEDDLFEELPIKQIRNPKKLLVARGDMTVFDSFKFADNESKKIARYYKKHPNNDIIVVQGNKVLDGNHRVMGSILGNWKLRAIDINDLSDDPIKDYI